MATRSRTSTEPTRNLRQMVLAASEKLIDQSGLGALSMREVARQAGVTHQAPYNHFANKEAIMAELITQGLNAIRRRLALVHKKHATQPAQALEAAGMVYVNFALDHPGVFRLMNRPEHCDITRFPETCQASEAAYGEFLAITCQACGTHQKSNTAPMYWALLHGLVSLTIDGHLGRVLHSKPTRRKHIQAAVKDHIRHMLPDTPSPGKR